MQKKKLWNESFEKCIHTCRRSIFITEKLLGHWHCDLECQHNILFRLPYHTNHFHFSRRAATAVFPFSSVEFHISVCRIDCNWKTSHGTRIRRICVRQIFQNLGTTKNTILHASSEWIRNTEELKRISVWRRAYSSGVVGIMYERIDGHNEKC